MRCILECRSRTKGQVHAGIANSCGVAAVDFGDSGLGKILWAEAAGATPAPEPADFNRSRHFRSLHSCSLRGKRLRERTGTSRSRSEEHTSELQSRGHLVCRLLLEKKKHRT